MPSRKQSSSAIFQGEAPGQLRPISSPLSTPGTDPTQAPLHTLRCFWMFPSDQKQKCVSGQGIQAGTKSHFHLRTLLSWNKTLKNKQEIKELQPRAHSPQMVFTWAARASRPQIKAREEASETRGRVGGEGEMGGQGCCPRRSRRSGGDSPAPTACTPLPLTCPPAPSPLGLQARLCGSTPASLCGRPGWLAARRAKHTWGTKVSPTRPLHRDEVGSSGTVTIS